MGFGYENFYVRDHYFGAGERVDAGQIRTNNFALDTDYGVTDRLAFRFSLPFVDSRYDGDSPHKPGGVIALDDGDYHGTLTDLRFELRYNFVQRPFYLTPFAAVIIPTHGYQYFSHSAPGRDLHEYQLGFSFGKAFEQFLPNTVVSLRYTFTYAQKVLDISHNRSNVDLEIGYFATPTLAIKALGFYQNTYGGVVFPPSGSAAFAAFVASPVWAHHDQIANADVMDVGFGFDYTLTGTTDIYAGYLWSVWGRNFHAIRSGIMLGVSFGFSPDQIIRSLASKAQPAGTAK